VVRAVSSGCPPRGAGRSNRGSSCVLGDLFRFARKPGSAVAGSPPRVGVLSQRPALAGSHVAGGTSFVQRGAPFEPTTHPVWLLNAPQERALGRQGFDDLRTRRNRSPRRCPASSGA